MDKKQLKDELKKAAEGMLTDIEIMESLGITEDILLDNYAVVSKTRLSLKQKLNEKRISEAAQSGETASLIEKIPRNKIKYKGEGHTTYTVSAPSRGGKREGAGRKVSSPTKLTGSEILKAIFEITGEKFEILLAQGYLEAIEDRDRQARLAYEKLILSKVVNDKVDIVINEENGIKFTVKSPEKLL